MKTNQLLFGATCAAIVMSVRTTEAREVLADPPTLRATVTMTVGGPNEERPEYEFGRISGLTFDAKGQIYVADEKENVVRLFSDKGAYLFTIGQKGAGPGDFNRPGNISVSTDGTLWVRDAGNQRFSLMQALPPLGKYVRSIPFVSTAYTADNVHWDPSGNVIGLSLAPSQKPGSPFRTLRSFIDAAGKTVSNDTSPPISPDSSESWIIRSGGGVANYSKPFGMTRLATYGGAGMAAFATNTRYAIRLVDARGRNVALITRVVSNSPLSDKEKAFVTASKERIAGVMKVASSSLELEMPQTKPIIASLGFDMDGRLWIERGVKDGSPHEADVYDRQGKWIAVMQWPATVRLPYWAVKGNTGFGVSTDTDDIQRVVKLSWK